MKRTICEGSYKTDYPSTRFLMVNQCEDIHSNPLLNPITVNKLVAVATN